MTAPLVRANGAAIPAIGLGTWPMTGDACSQAVRWAIEAGYRHVDTAKMYGNEEAVGAGLKASGIDRDEVFVTTKVWWEDIAAGRLERSAEQSLKRLGLSQVDLLLIHWPNRDVPLAESTAALCRAKRDGLARHIGVSNYNAAMVDEVVGLASEPLAVLQVEHHPRLDQTAVKAACRRHGLALTSYSPLGKAQVLEDPAVTAIAESHGRTPAQVVLRWAVQQPGVIAIPKSATRERIVANLDIFGFALSPDEMARLDALARPDGRLIDPAFAPDWDRPAARPQEPTS